MRIIQHAIKKGFNNVSLTLATVDHVKFETNEPTYNLFFSKEGYGRSQAYTATENDKINPSIFQICRDGLSELVVESTCDGLLILYLYEKQINNEKNTLMKEINEFKEKARDKHYKRFLNDGVLTYSILKDFQYYISDKETCNCFEKFIQNTFENVSEIKLRSNMNIIKSITVTSQVDTKCSLFCNGIGQIAFIDIKSGTHTYPFVIPVYACIFQELYLGFNDVVNCTINFFILPTEYLRIDNVVKVPQYNAECYAGTICVKGSR